MKKYNNEEKQVKEAAEKLVCKEFDKGNPKNKFSEKYESRKQQFLTEISDEPVKKKASKKKLWMVATALIFLVPASVYTANEVFHFLTDKTDYELDVTLNQEKNYTHDEFYKLKLGYLPENMEKYEHGDKYSNKDHLNEGGVSFELLQITNKTEFKELYTKDYQETKLGTHQVIIINRERLDGNDEFGFNTMVYQLFEKEGYILKTYVGNDMNEAEWKKVLENISLEETTKEEATPFQEAPKKGQKEEVIKKIDYGFLPENGKQIHTVGEKVKMNTNGLFNFTINKVEVLDDLSQLDENDFNFKREELLEKGILTSDNKLHTINQKIIEEGNGRTTVDEVIGQKENQVKFVYLTATLENLADSTIENLFLQNAPYLLDKGNKGWVMNEEKVDFTSYSGEVDYLDSHGEEKGFYNIPIIEGKEKREIHFGYFMDEDQLDKMFLPLFEYRGIDNIGTKDITWVDIRK